MKQKPMKKEKQLRESEHRKLAVYALALVLSLGLLSMVTLATPINPTAKAIIGSERGNPTGSLQSAEGQPGNATQIDIYGATVTDVWQGYYGNITGSIVLSDAAGNMFYNWTDASPTGEIYVARISNPTWNTLVCANLTHINTEEAALNISITKADGINETFAKNTHDAFSVGSTSFLADNCSFTTNGYGSAGDQSSVWDEVLLYDTTGQVPVFTTIIGQDSGSFNPSKNVDFETLIPINRSIGPSSQIYYFFLELS